MTCWTEYHPTEEDFYEMELLYWGLSKRKDPASDIRTYLLPNISGPYDRDRLFSLLTWLEKDKA